MAEGGGKRDLMRAADAFAGCFGEIWMRRQLICSKMCEIANISIQCLNLKLGFDFNSTYGV